MSDPRLQTLADSIKSMGKEIFDGPETPQMVRDAIEWFAAELSVSDLPDGMVLVPPWKGYALFGTGGYVLNHTPYPPDPELGAEIVVTLATEKDRAGGRKVGESRDTDPDAPPIQPADMVIRMGFTCPEAIDALEDQLIQLRAVNFPESVPLAARAINRAQEQS